MNNESRDKLAVILREETFTTDTEKHWHEADSIYSFGDLRDRLEKWGVEIANASRVQAMTECLGIASRHAAAEFVERDIRERIERIEQRTEAKP